MSGQFHQSFFLPQPGHIRSCHIFQKINAIKDRFILPLCSRDLINWRK